MILLIFVLFSFSLYYLWQRRHLLWLAHKLKGYTGYPIIGSAYLFLSADKILDVINDFHRNHGGPGKFWLGNRLFVYIDDPKHFEIILNAPDSLNKGDSYDFIVESIGHGLITLKSDEWRFHRKNLNPSFHYNVVKSFYPTFNRNLKIFINKLQCQTGRGKFKLPPIIQACAMDMICETTLGLEIKTQSEENPAFLHNAHTILGITAQRFFQPWIQPAMLFRLSKYSKPFYHSVDILNKLLEKLYASKKVEHTEYMAKTKLMADDIANNNESDEKPVEKNVFIDRIIKLALEDKVFTEQNVLDELKTVLLAGYETTATAATNICALLAIYPDAQEKLFEEIRSVLPDQKMDVTQEDIKNMPYLDAFIKEAFRFFPVVPVLTRSLKEDMCLGEVTIPKGTEYIMDIWNMHRTRSNWKFDATKFNPENFFPQNALPRHPYSYIPFSAGPRNCIGIKYGNIALKLIIVYMIRQYRIVTKARMEDLKFRMTVTLCLVNDDIFEIENRDNY
ncbi:probable cytochrome P450 313a4 [Contarinia nasturtii]|uniref:probable cytochrome P450 313a4 n=1 Tax=Contarinia nasturtii TaxID=265458 RepID=UPI0012D4BE70|nr:probable cytochrome P450 313a4 [Contarinia nasturtii]